MEFFENNNKESQFKNISKPGVEEIEIVLKNENIVQIKRDPFQISRNIFENVEYIDYEERKYQSFQANFTNDKVLKNKIKKYGITKFIQDNIIKNKEQCMRFLNLFNYDVDFALLNLLKIADSMNRLKLSDLSFVENDKTLLVQNILNTNLFELSEMKDKKNRPIIFVNFAKYSQFYVLSQYLCNLNLHVLNAIMTFFNNIISDTFIPGKVEQFNILMNFEDLDQVHFVNNYDDILKIVQCVFASRVNKIFILAKTQSAYSSFLNMLKYIYEYNKERIIFIDSNKISRLNDIQLDNNIDKEIFLDFFVNNHSNKSMNKSKVQSGEQEININLQNSPIQKVKNYNNYSLLNTSLDNNLLFIHQNENHNKEKFVCDEMKRALTFTSALTHKKYETELFRDHFDFTLGKEINNFQGNVVQNDANKNNHFLEEISVNSFEILNQLKSRKSSVLYSDKNINNKFQFKNLKMNSTNNINYNFINSNTEIPKKKEFILVMDRPRNDACCQITDSCIIY